MTRFIGVANIALHAFCPVDIATPAIEKQKRNISNTEKENEYCLQYEFEGVNWLPTKNIPTYLLQDNSTTDGFTMNKSEAQHLPTNLIIESVHYSSINYAPLNEQQGTLERSRTYTCSTKFSIQTQSCHQHKPIFLKLITC